MSITTWAKATTDGARRIDATDLQRCGLLEPGRAGTLGWWRGGRPCGSVRVRAEASHLVLAYLADGEPLEYVVPLSRTVPTFGGSRAWLHCPRDGCGRRVRILYGGRLFLCRTCRELVYPSTRESAIDRCERRATRLRERLGWPDTRSFHPSNGSRPKGMHRSTYYPLVNEYLREHARFLAAIGSTFGTGPLAPSPDTQLARVMRPPTPRRNPR